jgi:RND family efflux transporter MFP subunit
VQLKLSINVREFLMSDINSQINEAKALNVSKKPVVWGIHLLVTVVIFLCTFAIIAAMFSSKPNVKKWGSRPAASVGVETINLEASNYPVWIESYGSADPLTRTQLVSDVSGRVISVSNNIRAGASFKAGDTLLTIDPRDFGIEVDVAKSSVADAWVKYKQELAQADIAEHDWNVKPGTIEGRELALRKPQVAAALAGYNGAKARLTKAELNLERTEVKAPFDGKVLKQMVDLGQVLNPSQTIAEIYSTDYIEVRLPVKAQDLAHINLPADLINLDNITQTNLPNVTFEGELGGKTYTWQGKLVRSEGAFDASTRMLYLVAKLDNPFVSTNQLPALRVGQFLRAKIQGKALNNVYAIPRSAVSQNNMIAVAEKGVLKKYKINPLWTDANSVVIAADSASNDLPTAVAVINSSDKLILTPTANLASGTRVKSLNQADESGNKNKLKTQFAVSESTKAANNSVTSSTQDTGGSIKNSSMKVSASTTL